MLFAFSAPAQQLAEELFAARNWSACLIECRRMELAAPLAPRTALLAAVSATHLRAEPPDALLARFAPLRTQTEDPETAASAAYQAGRLHWREERRDAALDAFAQTFAQTTNRPLFLQAACSAFLVLEEEPALRTGREDLVQQINTSRALWSGELFAVSRLPAPPERASLPVRGFVGFYRRQISPAIGQRCTLHPSCSEYFHQAAARHGWLGIPMTTDRFIREPDVNHLRKKPLVIHGRVRYEDSVDQHDFWMNP